MLCLFAGLAGTDGFCSGDGLGGQLDRSTLRGEPVAAGRSEVRFATLRRGYLLPPLAVGAMTGFPTAQGAAGNETHTVHPFRKRHD